MEKLEWRETFQNQPAYYIFIDLTTAGSVNNLSMICQVLQNMTSLSISLKGSLRISVLGICILSNNNKCIFPMQSVKLNYIKLQLALDSIQDTANLLTGKEVFTKQELFESFQEAIQQYEAYYKVIKIRITVIFLVLVKIACIIKKFI